MIHVDPEIAVAQIYVRTLDQSERMRRAVRVLLMAPHMGHRRKVNAFFVRGRELQRIVGIITPENLGSVKHDSNLDYVVRQ